MFEKLSWRILGIAVLCTLILSALIAQWAYPYAAAHPQATNGAEWIFVPVAKFFTTHRTGAELVRFILWTILITLLAVVLHRKNSRLSDR